MHFTGFAARRARSRAGLLAAAIAIVAVTGGSIAGILGAAGDRIDDGVAELLAAAPPTASALRVETRLADADGDVDAAEQFRQVEDSLTAAIGDAPLDLTRSVRSAPVDATIDGRAVALLLGSEPGLESRAVLVAGKWPDGVADAVVRSTAAEQLGLAPGDTITIGETELRVSGTWQPKNASDPSWFSDEAVGSGFSGAAAGPVLVSEQLFAELDAALDLDAAVRWTIVPQDAAIGAAALAALSDAIPRLETATARLHNESPDAVTFDGDLADTVIRASRAAGAVTGVVAVPLLLIALLGGIVLALVARSLAGGRSGEEVLLRGRGRSGAARATLAVLESTVVAVLGSAVGVGIVIATLPVDPSTAWLVAAGAAVAAILILTIAVVTRRAVDSRSEDSGRGALVASVGPLVLAAIAASIAAAQFFAAGSPVTVRSDGSVRVDALALAAPALLLVTFGLAARVAATPALAIVERFAARGAGILPVLPARQLARRTRTVAAALLVVVLGAGVATYAAAFDGTATSTDASRSAFAAGGAVRIEFAPTGSDFGRPDANTEARYVVLDGVDSALAVSREVASLGRDAVSLLVVDADRLREIDPSYAAITAQAAPTGSDGDDLPILMTTGLASRIGVVPGDIVSVVVPTVPDPIDAVVAGIVPALPTTGRFGMLAERAAVAAMAERLGGSTPEINEVWLATDDPEGVSAQVRAITTRPVEVLTRGGASDAAVLGVGTSLAWVGAIACLVLALVGFAAVTGALHRERRAEGVPLRSLGFGAADQARSRGVELALTAASAILLGVGVGALAAWLTVPGLAGDLAFASGPWLAALVGLAAGLFVIGLLAANRVARDVARGGRA